MHTNYYQLLFQKIAIQLILTKYAYKLLLLLLLLLLINDKI